MCVVIDCGPLRFSPSFPLPLAHALANPPIALPKSKGALMQAQASAADHPGSDSDEGWNLSDG